jgi:hypothetical protein
MPQITLPTFASNGPTPTPEATPEERPIAQVTNVQAPFEAAQEQGAAVLKAAMDMQDLYNKSVVNDTFVNTFSPALQKLSSDYYSTSGKAAVDTLPQYQQSVNDLMNTVGSGLIGQQKMLFNEMAVNRTERDLQFASQHAGQQAASFAANTQTAMLANHLTNISDNPNLYSQELQNGLVAIKSYGEMPSVGQSPDEIQFHQNDFAQKAAETKYKAMAATDPTAAYNDFMANKSSLPGTVQTQLQAWLLPQVKDAATSSYLNTLPQQVAQLAGTSGSGVSANNLGNVKTAAGAANNTADFVNPATPVDGAILAANNLRSNYQGLTLQQIGAKWTGEPDKTAAWVAAASQNSWIAPNAVPNLNDPTQLQAVLKGMNVAENAPAKQVAFTDDVIAQGVQASLAGKQAATQPNAPASTSAYQTMTDAMVANRDTLLANAEAAARKQFPNDPAMVSSFRTQVNQTISAAAESQAAQYKQDNNSVMQAIIGNGQTPPPQTYQQLMADPKVADVVKRVAVQDPAFYNSIPDKIAEVASRNTTTNSSNGFDTIMRASMPIDPATMKPSPDAIESENGLNSLLGRKDGNGINLKDYNDAKPLTDADQTWKDYIHENMKAIANANGNVDGQGNQRAMRWYQQANQSYQNASKQPDFYPMTYVTSLNSGAQGPKPESWVSSRMDQIANMAKSIWNGTSTPPPSAIPAQAPAPEMVSVLSPDGRMGSIPAANVDKALTLGYKRVQ